MSPAPEHDAPPAPLRRWAARWITGPDARFIVDDLDEVYARERSSGRGRITCSLRYLVGAARSGWATGTHRRTLPFSTLDLRLGARMLGRHPVVSAVVVFSLVVGIPVGLLPVLLEDALDAPVPGDPDGRIVGLRYWGTATTTFDLQVLAASGGSASDVAAVRPMLRNVGPAAQATAEWGAEVSPDIFEWLGIQPALGRTLLASDAALGSEDVVLLGHRTWVETFGADPGIIGRAVPLSGRSTRVVGVMPEGFAFPDGPVFWTPLRAPPAATPADGLPVELLVRRPAAVSIAALDAELAGIVVGLAFEHPARYDRVLPEAVELTNFLVGVQKGGLAGDPFWRLTRLMMLSVLVVACLNIGFLMYARAVSREEQTRIRSALGATRARIVGQVLAEALVVALVATGAGLALLAAGGGLLTEAIRPMLGGLPTWVVPRATPRLVGTALALGIGSAVAASVLPAWTATRRMAARGTSFGRATSALVILDVAVAVAIAGLATGIFERIDDVRAGEGLGPVPDRVVLGVAFAEPTTPSGATASSSRVLDTGVRADLIAALRAEPAVVGVAVASALPRMQHRTVRIETDGALSGGREYTSVHRTLVAPGFFEALEIPLLDGRTLTPDDTVAPVQSVVVNRTFIDSVFDGRQAMGRRFRVQSRTDEREPWLQVVGVVPDAGVDLIDPGDAAGYYVPTALGAIDPLHVALRLGTDPAAFGPRVRELAARQAPEAIVTDLRPLSTIYPDDWTLMIAMAFAWTTVLVVLLALAVSGVYAILSFVVASGRRDLGIRQALGASPANLVESVVVAVRRNLLWGVALGVPVATLLYRMIVEDPSEGLTMLVVGLAAGIGVLGLVLALGALGPLRDALRISPSEVMRT